MAGETKSIVLRCPECGVRATYRIGPDDPWQVAECPACGARFDYDDDPATWADGYLVTRRPCKGEVQHG